MWRVPMGGAPSLQVHRTKGWGLFQVFLHLTIKECPCMFATTHMPSIHHSAEVNSRITGKTTIHNKAVGLWSCSPQLHATGDSEWQHVTASVVCYGVASLCMQPHKVTLYIIVQSFFLCIVIGTVLHKTAALLKTTFHKTHCGVGTL